MLWVLLFCVLLWEIERTHCKRKDAWESLGSFISHRAHRVHGAFLRTFRAHRTPPAYRAHRAFQLKMAVRFCDICRPQGLCGMLCVLFICVNLWERRNPVCSVHLYSSVRKKSPSLPNSFTPCQEFLLLSNRTYAFHGWRGGPLTFKNMLFLHAEHALLEARKACSTKQLVTYWFIERYNITCTRLYTRI